MRHYPASRPGGPWLVLAHGAGAGHDHPWMRRTASGLAARGLNVVTFDFPYMGAGRKLPDKGPVLEAAFADVWATVAAEAVQAVGPGVRLFGGGKSMGGRMASQAAARGLCVPAPAGLVFFGYPLHPPGKPSQRRDRHLPDVRCPMLFLHGTRDPFGTPDEMTGLAASLPGATLEIISGGDHSLTKASDRAGTLMEQALDVAAKWMLLDSRADRQDSYPS